MTTNAFENSYIKKVPVELMAYMCSFKNVETKRARKLNFYERAIVLLLSKGVKAVTIEELIDKISVFLNIKKSFVEEFINLLFELESLYDGGNKFSLSNSVVFEEHKNDKRILLSNVQNDRDDISFLYISQLDFVSSIKVPGLKFDEGELVQIAENLITPLGGLLAPHLKKIEDIAEKDMPNSLAMTFDSKYLMQELSSNGVYAKKGYYNVDIKYVYDESARQGRFAGVEKIYGDFDDSWSELTKAIVNYVDDTYSVDYDEPDFIRARGALDAVSSTQNTMLSYSKDIIQNKLQVESNIHKAEDIKKGFIKLEENIEKIKADLERVFKTGDQQAIIKEKLRLESASQGLKKSRMTFDSLIQSEKDIDTDNMIITHKIEDLSKNITKPLNNLGFSVNKPYFDIFKELVESFMFKNCFGLRGQIDAVARECLYDIFLIDNRCEESIKITLKNLKNYIKPLDYYVMHLFKTDESILSYLYDDSLFRRFKTRLTKTNTLVDVELYNRFKNLLALLGVFKARNDEDKSLIDGLKKSALKDFMEIEKNNIKYRKDAIFVLVEFIVSFLTDDKVLEIVESQL